MKVLEAAFAQQRSNTTPPYSIAPRESARTCARHDDPRRPWVLADLRSRCELLLLDVSGPIGRQGVRAKPGRHRV